jgi:hypothetical protein
MLLALTSLILNLHSASYEKIATLNSSALEDPKIFEDILSQTTE